MTDRVDAKAVLKAMRNSAFCPEPWAYTLAHLLADLEDWERASKKVMSEQCPPDERHCTCVPFLRKRLEAAEKALAMADVHIGWGDCTLENVHAIVRAALAGEKP
jgi:hypothetical protein